MILSCTGIDTEGNNIHYQLLTFVLPMFYADDLTPVTLTLVFQRNE